MIKQHHTILTYNPLYEKLIIYYEKYTGKEGKRRWNGGGQAHAESYFYH